MLAAKHFDPVVGIDIHLILTPAGVTAPIPHPFVGMVLDPIDYAPYIGSTVSVNGIPRGQAGSAVKEVPPHIPIGGTFVKPPGNEGEIFMGSSTVLAEGEPFTFTALPVLSCSCIGMPAPPRKKGGKSKSLELPTSVVLPVPLGPPIMVGGAPTVSMMALAMKGAMAGLGKLRKLQKASKKMAALSKRMKKAAKKAMDKLGVPPNVQNKVNKAICGVTGHPVDVATGKVFADAVDFQVQGWIDLVWERTWYSCSTYDGPLGRGWHHAFDLALCVDVAAGVVAVRLADGRATAFPTLAVGEEHFDRQEGLTLRRDGAGFALEGEDGRRYRFAPDGGEVQQLASIEDRLGRSIHFERGPDGTLETIVDSASRRLGVKTDGRGRILSVDAPHPDAVDRRFELVQYRYDVEGRLVAVVDAEGAVASYAYDGDLLVREVDRNGLTFHFEYDARVAGARCVRTWGDGDILHRVIDYGSGATTTVRDSLGATWTYELSESGVVVAVEDPLGHRSECAFTPTMEVERRVDPDGGETVIERDDRGRMIAATGPGGESFEFEYTGGELTRFVDADGASWSWERDDLGLVVALVDPTGNRLTYDRSDPRRLRIEDASGAPVEVELDRAGTVVRERGGPAGPREYLSDGLGRVRRIVGADSTVEEWTLDLLGRPTAIDRAGDRVELDYDGEGNVVRSRRGQTEVEFRYGGLGWLVARGEGERVVRYEHDLEGRLTAVVNEHRRRHEYRLDACGRVESEARFDGTERQLERDAMGRVVREARPGGGWSTFEYDAGGQVTSIERDDGTAETFEYDAAGRVVEANNDDARVVLERDALGRVVAEESNGLWVRSEWGADGKRSGVWTALGLELRFEHDTRGLLRSVDAAFADQHWATAIDRDRSGREVRRVVGDGASRRLAWSAAGVERSVIEGPAFRAIERVLGLDADGTVSSIQSTVGRRVDVRRDRWRRPVAEIGARDVTRRVDAVGNVFGPAPEAAVEFGRRGELLRRDDEHREYDAEGRLVLRRAGTETWTYSWDSAGRLRAVLRPDGERVAFAYDAFGRRIRKDTSEGTTHWLWDGNDALQEWTTVEEDVPQGVRAWIFAPGGFELLGSLGVAGPRWILCDHSGGPEAVIDAEGRLEWAGRLALDGRVETDVGDTCPVPARRPGQVADPDTGLWYNRFRYYDPEAQGYISPDPIGLRGGLNVYAYADDPLAEFDPLGLDTSSDAAALNQSMDDAGVPRPDCDHAAHHVVQSNSTDPKWTDARDHMEAKGVPVNSADNGVFLKKSSKTDISNAPEMGKSHAHSWVHTNNYRDSVTDRIMKANNADEVKKVLADVKKELLTGDPKHLSDAKQAKIKAAGGC